MRRSPSGSPEPEREEFPLISPLGLMVFLGLNPEHPPSWIYALTPDDTVRLVMDLMRCGSREVKYDGESRRLEVVMPIKVERELDWTQGAGYTLDMVSPNTLEFSNGDVITYEALQVKVEFSEPVSLHEENPSLLDIPLTCLGVVKRVVEVVNGFQLYIDIATELGVNSSDLKAWLTLPESCCDIVLAFARPLVKRVVLHLRGGEEDEVEEESKGKQKEKEKKKGNRKKREKEKEEEEEDDGEGERERNAAVISLRTPRIYPPLRITIPKLFDWRARRRVDARHTQPDELRPGSFVRGISSISPECVLHLRSKRELDELLQMYPLPGSQNHALDWSRCIAAFAGIFWDIPEEEMSVDAPVFLFREGPLARLRVAEMDLSYYRVEKDHVWTGSSVPCREGGRGGGG
jgi:hypothetical protein